MQKTLAKTYFIGFYPKLIPFEELKTLPYLMTEPVVTTTTTTKLELAKGEGKQNILTLASDGFWDHVSNEQAVKLVRVWMESRGSRKEGVVGDKNAKIDRIDEEM